jgi:hypothetical protein
MKKLMTAITLGALLATSTLPAEALAQPWSDHGNGHRDDDRRDNDRRDRDDRDRDRGRHDRRDNDRRGPPTQKWRGWHSDRDIRHFDRYDRAKWRGGHWWRGRHNERDGWWWVVGNLFYPYAARYTAIPDPYTPPVIIANGRPMASSSWYYCGSPSGYYPYVQACRVPWRSVVRW